MKYRLPNSVTIDNEEYIINNNGDYRVILDIISCLNDKRLTDQEKIFTALSIFYKYNIPKNYKEAIKQMYVFINCGAEITECNQPTIMDWEQDFDLLIAPISNVFKNDIRAIDIHWWTFVSAYLEIPNDSYYMNIIRIRLKRQKGQKLDKQEQEFFRDNADKIILKSSLSKEDEEWLNEDW